MILKKTHALSISMCPLLFGYNQRNKWPFWMYKNNCSKHKHYRSRLKWPSTLLFKMHYFKRGRQGSVVKNIRSLRWKLYLWVGKSSIRRNSSFNSHPKHYSSRVLRLMPKLKHGVTGPKTSSLPWGICLNILLNIKESFMMGTSPITLPTSWLCTRPLQHLCSASSLCFSCGHVKVQR